MRTNRSTTTKCKSRILYFIVFLAGAGMILFKCRYGSASRDESFYLTIPYRLFLGDSLFLHEWNLSQLSGFLLYPLIKAFISLFGNTDWIILAFRYLFTLLHMATSLFLFFALRRQNWNAAAIISLIYLFYAPFGIMALSYNSMGLASMVIMLVLIDSASKKRSFFLAGAIYAFSVLCCPYLVILYFYFLFITVFQEKKERGVRYCKMNIKNFIYWTAGIATVAIIFLTFLFAGMRPQQMETVLPYVLNDPEHSPRSFKVLISSYFKAFQHDTIMNVTYLAGGGLLLAALIDRKRTKKAAFYFVIVSVIVILQVYNFTYVHPYINFLMLPINLYLPFLLIFGAQRYNVKKNTVIYVVPGLIYTFCIHCASNQQLYNISSVSFVIMIGTILMLFETLSVESGRKETHCSLVVNTLAVAAISIMLLSLVNLRYNDIFWEKRSMRDQTALITDGPQKGIRVSPERYTEYYTDYNDVMLYTEKGKVLYWTHSPMLYLMTDNEFAAPSAWMAGSFEEQLNILNIYYNINPDKFPTVIMCETANRRYADKLLEGRKYTVEETPNGYSFYYIR